MGASVQFYGKDQVMSAAEARNCSCWGIYINRALFCKYEDTDMTASLSILQQNLEVLEESGTEGTYTVKFFECDGKPIKITEKTVCDGGQFNFKLTDPQERANSMMGLTRPGQYSSYIKVLEDRLKKLEDETEVDPPEETLGSVLIDLVKKPAELAQVVNIGRALFGLPVQNLGAITGIRPGIEAEALTEEQRMLRLEKSMNTLEQHDPGLLNHLEKLAKMAEENPDQFKATVSMLDLYK